MSDLTERVLSRVTKTASWDGPFLWRHNPQDGYLTVWVSLDTFGRVHHVTKDLTEAEKRLYNVQRNFVTVFRSATFRNSVGEIYIDGASKSGARNPMVMYFNLTWDEKADPELLDKLISTAMKTGIKDLRKMAKAKTFPEAKAEIWEYLKSKNWKLSDPNLKVAHATSPDTDIRVWFKQQAVYYTVGTRHNFKDARSLHMDIRRLTPEQFVKQVIKWAEDED